MLRGMRKASSNWLGKTIMAVVMGVLIISFGVWGIADIFKGFGQSTVAKVGSTEISLNEFRQTYTDRLQQISRQFGRPLTPDQARAFGLDRQVLQQTIAEAALDEEARRLGLGQSDEQIRQVIMNDPNFKGVGGSFDPNRFQAVIRNFGYTEQRYVSEQRKVSLRRQITGTIGAGLEPPKAMIDVLTRFQNEQRAIEFVRLDAAQAGTIDAPSPEALAAYFEDHKVQFRAPEYRKISFVVVSPEEIGKWSEVSDEDAKKVFDQRKDRLGTPEKRQIHQIVFPNVAEAQAARERLAGGMSFEDLGKERGLSSSDVDLGLVTKSSLDPAVGDAAFALPAGEISQPIQGRLGTSIVKVDKIEPGSEANYASLVGDIKREIATERARVKVNDLRDKMEDERGGGASVIDAAQKLGLTAVTIDAVDRSGRAPNGQPVTSIPQGLDVVSQAFNTDVGVDNDAISFKGGYVWYDVLAITPSRDRNLDEVRDQVEARWRQDQIAAKLKTKATEMVQKLEQGGKLADEAAAINAKVETASGFKRDDSPAGVPANVVAAAFRTAKDGVGQTAVSGGSEVIVFRVTDIVEPAVDAASDAVKKLKDSLVRALTDEQVASYVNKLETDIGTTINQAAFAQVTGANQ
ncbi:SurA N-terminal domain-containing protein [Bradyrhizobium japonicum]|uniref:Parvulin-like PPIase n=1 Tax=Bradyrhizobium japonicum TaxID=375 RepID=A0ABV2RWP5_BRAJP|nr:SurA N-terminal domain-containing protein [Bradyrhizobium japonicum]MCD9108749.1 SurA N-terminal domain-containing protein [Bradyrhizobium japonicum]MCD9255763.1 SurA N-terminal domain-containing protein [Bradyrhizobium japonicum SEMIA 5079]MCD9820478.1 SurA N-terminal domain-containing protein [Bradyrhizobium japonicum]MCD9892725.1 SurA N-terminal domain-containing protein [Bradyrhizobium japonicum]MCD9908629.1 SurA N-terminal domain-containing protein [Bradyrhizobium japonicum]